MQPETSSSDITIHLRRDTTGAHNLTSEITVRLSEGVDLGSVGRALGLYPHTVRLYGYYVSRSRPYYVSPGLSWGTLLDFFAQRGLPCGNSEGDAIVVQGKHAGSTDGNAFLKREFELVTETPLKKRKLEANYRPNENVTLSRKRSLKFQLEMESPPKRRMLEANLKPNENVTISTKRSRKFQSEMESALKKRKDGTNYKPSENVTLFPKRSLNSDDVPLPSKMMKTACSNANTQISNTATAFSHLTIYLQLYPSVGSCGASPPKHTITVSWSSAVDLGLVARVLGVDPKTVRLNGYYVSRTGPHYVSPYLLWGHLLDFFAQRGLPCGSEVQDAILIQGKFVSSTDGNLVLKRKVGLGTGHPVKKRKLTNYKSSESVIHHSKRTINSDDIHDLFKRMKTLCSSTVRHKFTPVRRSLVSKLVINARYCQM